MDNTNESRKVGNILIGHLSPPITGQSESFELLISHFKKAKLLNAVIDIGSREKDRRVGKFSLTRVGEILNAGFEYCRKLYQFDGGGIYLSIGISSIGFLRDSLFIWLAVIRKFRIILQLHGGGYREFYLAKNILNKYVIKKTISKANYIIVLSTHLIHEFDFIPGIEKKICVIHNTSQVNEEVLSVRKNYYNIPFRILYLSNLIPSKGYMDLLDAAVYLNKLNCEFIFCGKFLKSDTECDQFRTEFLQKLSDHSRYGVIKYLGPVSGQEKWDILAEISSLCIAHLLSF